MLLADIDVPTAAEFFSDPTPPSRPALFLLAPSAHGNPQQVDPGETFWTEDEIAEELKLYGKDEANETLEKLFQVQHSRFTFKTRAPGQRSP